MRSKTLFARLAMVLAAVVLTMVAMLLLAEPAQADGDYRRPGVTLSIGGPSCTFEDPPKAQIDYFIDNTSADSLDLVFDYRLSAVGRPDLEPHTGVVTGELRHTQVATRRGTDNGRDRERDIRP